jgi:hypothetical protein
MREALNPHVTQLLQHCKRAAAVLGSKSNQSWNGFHQHAMNHQATVKIHFELKATLQR